MMPKVPGLPDASGEGLRQQRAAQLKADMEAMRQQQQGAVSSQEDQDRKAEEELKPTGAHVGIDEKERAEEFEYEEEPDYEEQQSYDGEEDDDEEPLVEEEDEEDETGPVGIGEYPVKEGECVSSIAKDTGHHWETIWTDPSNAELKDVREDPNVLLPDDRVTIPPLQKKQEPCEAEMRHRFVRRGEPSMLWLKVLAEDEPLANRPYRLVIDRHEQSGTTGADGRLSASIPGNAKKAKLYVEREDGEEPIEYELLLGKLDPVEQLTGVQARLTGLGFDCGDEKGELGPETTAALEAFQRRFGPRVTGEPDQPTRDRLLELFDHARPLTPKAQPASDAGSVRPWDVSEEIWEDDGAPHPDVGLVDTTLESPWVDDEDEDGFALDTECDVDRSDSHIAADSPMDAEADDESEEEEYLDDFDNDEEAEWDDTRF